jgi:hypothetical protein
MNLGPQIIKNSYPYLLVQSGNNPIKLGNNADVNWIAGGVVASTGNQTISGVKTFASDVSAISFGSGREDNYIAPNSSYNRFGNAAVINEFGRSASDYNEFGSYANANEFGSLANVNEFGSYASGENSFGKSASINSFGFLSQINYFGENAILGNYFGENARENYFGSATGQNLYAGVSIFDSTGRMRLASFTGASSQTGLRGEARVSGTYLYICTGSTSQWGRVQLTSF